MKTTRHPWYKPRGYVHFDRPLGLAAAERLVCDPRQIAKHAFYPFLRYQVVTQKIEKHPATGKAQYKDPKIRPISYAAHADAHIYAHYGHVLSAKYEMQLQRDALEASVLAFRPLGKSNIDFANAAFEQIKRMGDCVAFATDITGFFDNLDHNHLKCAWAGLLQRTELPEDHYAVFKSLTHYSIANKSEVFSALGLSENNPPRAPARLCSPTEFRTKIRGGGLITRHVGTKGIPQGSPISALLSNVYLLEFDRLLYDEVSRRQGVYMRYCDDILCIVPTSLSAGLGVEVERLIEKYKLEINEKKTETIEFVRHAGALVAKRPLQYLGFTFDGKRKIIRSAAFARFSDKMRRGVSLAKQTARKQNKKMGRVDGIWKRRLYERYSHLGSRNFIRYGLKAASIMRAPEINRQLRPLWKRLERRIQQANAELTK